MSAAINSLGDCRSSVETHRFDNISVKVSLIGQRHTPLRTDRLYPTVRLQMQELRI